MGEESPSTPSEKPFGKKKYIEIKGRRMAYIDEGEGDPIVFQHGNPTSSYLWRNVMPASAGLGRLIACDLMGFGDSDKLDPDLGRDRYSYQEQRKYLFALWEELGLGDEVILVLHDIGSILGFDWANQNRQRVKGIAYLEALVMPLQITDFPGEFLAAFAKDFTPEGRDAAIYTPDFIEGVLLRSRDFSEIERAHYLKPFLIPGEDRRPMYGTEFAINGVPLDTFKVMQAYSEWLGQSDVAKLLINVEPGFILSGRLLEFARSWPNQTEVTVPGHHFAQEECPAEIGDAIASFVRSIRK